MGTCNHHELCGSRLDTVKDASHGPSEFLLTGHVVGIGEGVELRVMCELIVNEVSG